MNKQKGLLVRLATLLATLAIAMCAAVPALAADEPTGTITASGFSETFDLGNNVDTNVTDLPVTAKLYKVIDAVYDDNNNLLYYKWNDSVADWVKTNFEDYYKDITLFTAEERSDGKGGIGDSTALGTGENVTANSARDFYNKLAAAIKDDNGATQDGTISLSAIDTKTITTGDTITFDQQKAGGYLIVFTGQYKVYQASAVALQPAKNDADEFVNPVEELVDATVTVKSTLPTLEKTINNVEYVGAQIGDTVNYKVDADVPVYPRTSDGYTLISRNYELVDFLPTGVSLVTNTDGTVNSKDGDGAKGFTLTGTVGKATTSTDSTSTQADETRRLTYNIVKVRDSTSYEIPTDVDCNIYVESSDGAKDVHTHNYSDAATQSTDDVTSETCTYRIIFNYDKLNSYGLKSVSVEYNGVINESIKVNSAATGTGSYDNGNTNTNKARLDYSNEPFATNGWAQIPDEATVYSYKLQLIKKGYTNQSGDKPLQGVEFELKKGGSTLNVVPTDSNYNDTSTDTKSGYYRIATGDDTSPVTKLYTNANGEINIKGLGLGTYTMTETATVDGYVLDSTPISFDFVDKEGNTDTYQSDNNGPDGKLETSTTVTDQTISDDKTTIQKSFINKQGFDLPKTGGMGIAIFSAVGVILAGCGVALYRHSRKVSER